jgi:adenine phosphoribosyltransferase
MELKNFIRDIPDFPKPGILFKDITPLLKDPEAFRSVIDLWVSRYEKMGLNAVVAMESRGFIFAAPLAVRLGIPFVPVRKPGKLPYQTIRETYELEYGTDSLEIHSDALAKGDKVLVLDDVLATGGTAAAVTRLVERVGGKVEEASFLMELTFLKGRDKLKSIPVHSIIQY